MRKFLAFALAACLFLSMVACAKKEPENKSVTFQGTSDGTFAFTEGNIKFTVPNGQLYTVAQTSADSGHSVSICGLGIGDSHTSISAIDVSDLSKDEIKEKLAFWNSMDEQEFADYSRYDDISMDIMGQEAIFKIYLNEAKEHPQFHIISNFTDSNCIYLVEIKLAEITDKYYAPVIQLMSFSEYIGPERRFEFFQ